MQKIIAICGPTASGKTSLSLELAKEFPGKIVSADSRQIYRGMDIGTAKPRKDPGTDDDVFISAGIPHHLIDIKNPDEDYSLAQYKDDAEEAISRIAEQGEIPFLVGGTGLYMDALLYNLTLPDVSPDPQFRLQMEERIREEGLGTLFAELCDADPEAAYIVDGRNPRRVIRALEIARATGEPFSASRKKGPQLFDILKIGVRVDGETLKNRIDVRVDEMMHNGLVGEVLSLRTRYGRRVPAFDAIGYIEILDALDGEISIKNAVESIKRKTAAYAKRQMTWFKKDPTTVWIDSPDAARDAIRAHLDSPSE